MSKVLDEDELLCPIRYSLNIIGGKWKLAILCLLAPGIPTRYGEIKKKIGTITNMMLSQSLKELEHDGIVYRKQYNEIPPKVEYTLTEDGASLLPTLKMLASWGSLQMNKVYDGMNACEVCKNEKRK